MVSRNTHTHTHTRTRCPAVMCVIGVVNLAIKKNSALIYHYRSLKNNSSFHRNDVLSDDLLDMHEAVMERMRCVSIAPFSYSDILITLFPLSSGNHIDSVSSCSIAFPLLD